MSHPHDIINTMLDCSGIYKIENISNGRYYIGSSQNIRKRRNSHLIQLRKNNHHCSQLQKAYNKYGEKNFKFIVIEVTDNLTDREQYYLDNSDKDIIYNTFMSAYSVSGPDHPMYGKTHTEEAKTKIKERRSLQTISHSEETRKKIGKSNIGKKLSKESIEKMKKTKRNNPKQPWNKGLTINDHPSIKNGIDKITMTIDIEKTIKLYCDGYSINEISKVMNCSWDVVNRALVKNNIRIRSISEQKQILDKRKKLLNQPA